MRELHLSQTLLPVRRLTMCGQGFRNINLTKPLNEEKSQASGDLHAI